MTDNQAIEIGIDSFSAAYGDASIREGDSQRLRNLIEENDRFSTQAP